MSEVHSSEKDIERDLAGMAGEHLVCAEFFLAGHYAWLVGGCPYDVLADVAGRVLRVQVKTTMRPRIHHRQRCTHASYLRYVRRCGKNGKLVYKAGSFDLLALVALDIRKVVFMPLPKGATVQMRPPGQMGKPDHRSKHFENYTLTEALLQI